MLKKITAKIIPKNALHKSMMWQAAVSLVGILYVGRVYSHEDLDLGITQIKFDKQCHPIVTVKNTGERPLPSTFYLSVNPAYISLEKHGKQQNYNEMSKSLRALDRKKNLQPVGGELDVLFEKAIANNPAAITAVLNTQAEFWEYNQQNDRLSAPLDCVPGKGEVAGTPDKPDFADLALININVKPHSCEIHLTIINHNNGPIAENSWKDGEGIIISVYDVKNEARLAPIMLSKIDPNKTLNTGQFHFSETRAPGHYRYSLWQVHNDPDFSNNHQEIDMSECK